MEGERELPDLCKYSAHSLFAEAISWDQCVCFRLAGIALKLCSCVCGREKGGLPKGVVDTRELRSDRKSRSPFRILMWRSTVVLAFHETLNRAPLYQHLTK